MNKNSYNKIAKKWTEVRNKSFVSKLVISFADKINPQGNILDIGCGSGYLAKYLCDRNFQVTGVDISETMIEIAKLQKIINAEFIACDFLDFISTQIFDGVLARDSFFHFPKEKQESLYSNAGRFLKPGGYLIFTHGNLDDEHIDEMMDESFYYSCLPKDKVLQTLTSFGFDIEYAYEDFIEQDTHRSLVVLAKKR